MANELLKVDHPSVSDLRRTLDNLESVLAEYADAQYRSIARHIESRERESVSEEEQRIYDRKKPAVESLTRDRDHIRNFLKNGSHFLGSVFAGSGLYRQAVRGGNKHNHLDWALINIPQQRLGPSKVGTVFPDAWKVWLTLSPAFSLWKRSYAADLQFR